MESISDISYNTIRKLILESEWGQSVTNKELFSFLFSEVYEFVDGCNKNNKDNMLEEASDVLMILLYIVIKNIDEQQDNQIDELLRRLNKKLQTRYSLFFEGNADSALEELQWAKTKHMEKEVLNYLYCPVFKCKDYAKTNKGNMVINGDSVRCISCGYSEKCSSHNMILYTSKSRRELMETLENYFVGYIKGGRLFADDYFNSYRQQYLKVIRYWAYSETGKAALNDFFSSRHNVSEELFDEFLMQPLRNCLQNVFQDHSKFSRSIIEINDLMLRCINVNYSKVKLAFCKDRNSDYLRIWVNYMCNLLNTMTVPIKYDLDGLPVQAERSILPFDSFKVYAFLNQDKAIDILIKKDIADGQANGVCIEVNLSICKLNTEIGQVLLSVIMKFGLQHVYKVQCVCLGIGSKIDCGELSEFLKDVLPMLENIEYR